MDVLHNFLRKLKEDGILIVKWVPGPTNNADLHTKNLAASNVEKHVTVYTGKDKYFGMN